jgi:hypothetical protein
MGYLISIITSHEIFLMTGYSNLLTDQHKENIHQILLTFHEKRKFKNFYMVAEL